MILFALLIALYLTFFVGELLHEVSRYIETLTIIKRYAYKQLFPAPAPKPPKEEV